MKRTIGFLMPLLLLHTGATAQVGINTNAPNPNVGLHVVSNAEAIRLDGNTPYISFFKGTDYRAYLYVGSDNNMTLMNRSANGIYLGTNNSYRMYINSAGNIGMGTSQPESPLHVAEGTLSGTFQSNTIAGFEKSSGSGYVSVKTLSYAESGILFADETSSSRGGIIYNNPSTADGLQLRTNGNITRMSIDAAGDVGIGITNASRPLHVKSRNGGDEYGIRIDRSGSSTNWEMSLFQGNFCWFYNGALSPTAYIATNGNYQSSDRRLKQHIQSYKNVLPMIMQLQVSKYDYIQDETHKPVIGLIAQDVHPLFPEIVMRLPSRENGGDTYAIDYSKLGVLAVKAIQELTAQLEAQERANEELQRKLDLLEQQQEKLWQQLQKL